MSAINPIYCPNCKKWDNVSTAPKANLSAPPKPSDTAVTLVKIMRLVLGGLLCFCCGNLLVRVCVYRMHCDVSRNSR